MRNFKKFLALALAVMMVMSGVVTVSAAEEVTSAEETVVYDYTAAAEELATLGVVKGTSDDVIDFTLEEKVLRYQMTLLFARITTGECDDDYWKGVENTTPFNDIDNWFGAIDHCYEEGIIMGKEIDTFGPYDAITYEQALTMAVRALGYKQLDYYEGFVNFAKKLGLTNGLEELAIGTQLTRGQMFQITYNTMFALGTDGKTFAAKCFGIVDTVYVVVATERQHLAGAGSNTGIEGLVRLAKLNADGTYDFEDTILLNTTQIGFEKATDVEAKLAYSYTVSTSPKTGIYKVVENDSAKFVNYGDAQADTAKADTINAYAVNSVKIGGVNYKLVDSYNKNAVANELIVHSMWIADTKNVTAADLDYDAAGNILYPAGHAKAGQIGLMYNAVLGKYFFVKEWAADGTPTLLRPATDADLDLFVITTGTTGSQTYGIAGKDDILANKFFEITLIDDNGDGTFDRGIHIPYSFGRIGSTDKGCGSTSYAVYNPFTGKTTKSGGSTVYLLKSGTYNSIRGYVYNEGKTMGAVIDEKCYIFTGDTYTSGNYQVFWYNPYSYQIHIVENLGTAKKGVVNGFTFGTYDEDNAVWKNAKVTIGETEYVQGYRVNDFYNMKMLNHNTATSSNSNPFNAPNNTTLRTFADLTHFDSALATNGFDEFVLTAAALGSVRPVNYVAVAGRVVYLADAGTTTDWIAFDYGSFEDKEVPDVFDKLLPTSKIYKGDIVGIDENGYIEVNAYVDGKGDKKVTKIATIDGKSYVDYLKTLGAYEEYAAGLGIYDYKYTQLVRQYVISLLAPNYEAGKQYVFCVTGENADGAIDLYTGYALYGAGDTYRQPATNDSSVTNGRVLTFTNGVADQPYKDKSSSNQHTTASNNILKMTDASVITVFGKDGIKVYKGMPKDGDKLVLDTTNCDIFMLGNGAIVIASAKLTCAEIFTGFNSIDYAGAKYYTAFSGTSVYYTDGVFETTDKEKASAAASYVQYAYVNGDYKPTYTYKLWDIVANQYVEFTSTKVLDGFTFPAKADLTNIELRGGKKIAPVAVDDGMIYVVVDGKVKTTVAEDNAAAYVAEVIYPAVYSNLSFIEKASKIVNELDLVVENDLVDKYVSFKNIYFVQYNYKAGDVAVTVGNTAAYDSAKFNDDVNFIGTHLYYNYTAGASFAGAFVAVVDGDSAQLDAAAALIDAAAAGYEANADVAALVAEAKAALAAARANDAIVDALTKFMAATYADVAAKYVPQIQALVADIKAAEDAAADAAAQAALAAAKAAAIERIEKACTYGGQYYRYEQTVFEAAKAADAAVNAATTIADVDAAALLAIWGTDGVGKTDGIVYEIEAIIAAEKAATDAEAAAKAELDAYKREAIADLKALAGAIAEEAIVKAVIDDAAADILAEADKAGVDEAVVVAEAALAAAKAKYEAELAAAVAAAKAAVAAKTSALADLTAAKAAANTALDAAVVKADVEAALDAFDAAVKAAEDEAKAVIDETAARNAAKVAAHKELNDAYAANAAVATELAAALAAIDACPTTEDVATVLAEQKEILKAAAEAAAEAAKVDVIVTAKDGGKKIEVLNKNIPSFSHITFHTLQDNGVLFKDVVAELPVGGVVVDGAGATIGTWGYVTDGNSQIVTLTSADTYVDAYGNFLPILVKGETYGVTVARPGLEPITTIVTVG